MKRTLILASILLSFSLLSCGKKSSGGGELAPQDQTFEPEGIYSATLTPVNQKLSKNVSAVVTISKFGDDLNVRMKLKNGPEGMHVQGLYTGDTCPADDANADSYIDIMESEKNIGRMLIPFDGEIGSQSVGSDFYPSGESYEYERSTSFSLMLSDLEPGDKPLDFEGKIIVVHGVPDTRKLPATAATVGSTSAQKMIPIACGILRTVPVEPTEDGPEATPIRVRPSHPRPTHENPETNPADPTPHHSDNDGHHSTIWSRFRDRLERWWNRLGGWIHL